MKRSKFTESNFGRLLVLVFSIALVMFTLRIHLILTITIRECWIVEDIWLYQPTIFSPLSMYIICFILLALWAIIEACISWKTYRSKSNTVISMFALFSVLIISVGLYHFWQYILIERGELTLDDYLVKLTNFRVPESYEYEHHFPSLREYVYEERCSNGLHMTNITSSEMSDLRREYDIILQQALNNTP